MYTLHAIIIFFCTRKKSFLCTVTKLSVMSTSLLHDICKLRINNCVILMGGGLAIDVLQQPYRRLYVRPLLLPPYKLYRRQVTEVMTVLKISDITSGLLLGRVIAGYQVAAPLENCVQKGNTHTRIYWTLFFVPGSNV